MQFREMTEEQLTRIPEYYEHYIPFAKACAEGKTELALQLMSNASKEEELQPIDAFSFAAMDGHTSVVKFLLNNNHVSYESNAYKYNISYDNALKYRHVSIVGLLIRNRPIAIQANLWADVIDERLLFAYTACNVGRESFGKQEIDKNGDLIPNLLDIPKEVLNEHVFKTGLLLK